jgi:hypothetical protein
VDGQTDRQTDMTKLTVTFCNFANTAKNTHSFSYCYTDMLTPKLKCSTLVMTNSTNGQDRNVIDNMLSYVLLVKHSTWTECVRNLLFTKNLT